jgi:hypothetical protein
MAIRPGSRVLVRRGHDHDEAAVHAGDVGMVVAVRDEVADVEFPAKQIAAGDHGPLVVAIEVTGLELLERDR